jgi:hypothetical protein
MATVINKKNKMAICSRVDHQQLFYFLKLPFIRNNKWQSHHPLIFWRALLLWKITPPLPFLPSGNTAQYLLPPKSSSKDSVTAQNRIVLFFRATALCSPSLTVPAFR